MYGKLHNMCESTYSSSENGIDLNKLFSPASLHMYIITNRVA